MIRWFRLRRERDTGPSSTEVLARTANTLTRLSARKMTRPTRNANAAKAAEARRVKKATDEAATTARLKAEVARMLRQEAGMPEL